MGRDKVGPEGRFKSELHGCDASESVAPELEVKICGAFQQKDSATANFGTYEHVRSDRASIGAQCIGQKIDFLESTDPLQNLDLFLGKETRVQEDL